jgi:hypothetical protein
MSSFREPPMSSLQSIVRQARARATSELALVWLEKGLEFQQGDALVEGS